MKDEVGSMEGPKGPGPGLTLGSLCCLQYLSPSLSVICPTQSVFLEHLHGAEKGECQSPSLV